MIQATDTVEEIFRNLGIDHLVSTVKDILKLRNLILLKLVTREEFEQVLKAVDIPAEKRALLMAFEQVTGTMSDVKFNSVETEIREAIKQAGLDDDVWVRKIKEGFKLETLEQLKFVIEEQVEVFLKPIAIPIQSVLIQVFEKVTKINMAKLNKPEELPSQRSDVTAAEAVRSVKGGVLCQGIFLSEDVNELVQEQEVVIDVSENLEFKETRSVHEIFHNEFTCKETMQMFVNHLDKHLPERSASIGVNIWGVSLDKASLSSCQTKNQVSSVHYQRIPVATVDIPSSQIHLRPEVVTALQHVEKSLKKADYEPKDHFKDFFKIYGTHISHGSIEFGGTLVSAAYCEGFREEDRRRITDAVIEVSEAALLLDVNKKVRPGQPFNAHEILGKTIGINMEDLKKITVVVKKIGGSQKPEEKDNWKQGLRDNHELWEVVQRSSQPKPIWKMLLQHRDAFENYLGLASAMQEEWKIAVHIKKNADETSSPEKRKSEVEFTPEKKQQEAVTEETSERPKARLKKSKRNEEMEQRIALRADIQMWIDRNRNLSQQTVDACIKSLAALRKKYDKLDSCWQNEIIYLRDVQMKLLWVADFIKKATTNQDQKMQLIAAMRHILIPVEEIHESHFPKFRHIKESIRETSGPTGYHVFDGNTLRRVTDILKEEINKITDGSHLEMIQLKLERTAKEIMINPEKRLHYLTYIGVVSLFGFNVNSCLFENQLSKEDVNNMISLFEASFDTFSSAPKHKQQAYLLNIGLCCMNERQMIVQYMIDRMPGVMCNELKEACKNTEGHEDRINLEKLQEAVDKVQGSGGFELKTLTRAIINQLKYLQTEEKVKRIKDNTDQYNFIGKEAEKLLEVLDMRRYFPQKLKYEDVIMLSSGVTIGVGKKPTSLAELPWYFMKQIIGLDSDTRENCHILNFLDEESDEDDESTDERTGISAAIHPLDLIYIIFLCADDFLRQELSEKMTRCQYAVPFILPQPYPAETESLILHWGLKSMTRNFYSNNVVVNKTLVDTEAPLISFLSMGEETSWKTKLLNKMLSPQQETFWHQGLKGGNYQQKISEGMVEVAWYLPGRHEDHKFPYPVAFANVRQNAIKTQTVCDRLYKSSTLTCIFAEEVTSDLKDFLKQNAALEKIIIILLHPKDKENQIKEESKQLQIEFSLEKHQLIRRVAQDTNFDIVYEQLKRSILRMVVIDTHSGCLSSFVNHAKDMEGMEVDDRKCYHGQMAAETILNDIDALNAQKPGSAKNKILPCQSDLTSRKGIAGLDKELCRQRKLSENTTVQSYGYEIEEKKWKLQLKQLRMPMSDSFKYFLHCLLTFDENDRKYFLQSLKIGLNGRSMQQLLPLYEEYEKWRIEDESKERSEKLKELDEQLTHGSLGIEHFFREMAVIYENTLALRDMMGCNELDKILDLLVDTMAAVFLQGTAIEVMDGDAVNVPVAWLSAVLNRVENSGRSTLFKVSVLGAQSCGKSTLLNTIFGLNFPVSSGRCTRGAYMQLVKVDEMLKKTLQCDYVAVIDSEGLMSRTKVDGTDFDNELSTFIIGLSDLTLVIIKGEGNEMHDVLPLAIHVFLRMNIVGEHQACHFVHQNMGAVDVMTKVATEIEAFVRDLNAKTLAAAKDVDQSDRYTKFTDVLHYDPTTDNTYVPGLWDGTLPMGKTNSHYSKTMARLKSDIAACIVKMETENRKGMCTFADLAKRLEELWTAIKFENFVLSFKNVLAVEAHRKLSKVFDEEQWDIKREVRDMIQREEHVIENEIKGGSTNRSVKQRIKASQQVLINCVLLKIAEVEKRILHYFQCTGCRDCDAEVTNRHLLANNEKEFKDEVRHLQRTLVREIEDAMEDLEIRMRTDKRIHELSTSMDGILKKKVQEAIRNRKGQDLSGEAIEEIFEDIWAEAAGDILKSSKEAEKEEGIEAYVQATIKSLLGSDAHLYLQIQTPKGPAKRQRRPKRKPALESMDVSIFAADHKRHMKLYTIFQKVKAVLSQGLDEQDAQRLKLESERIIDETSRYYNGRLAPDGKQFNPKDAELLFKEVLRQIDSIKDERFKITKEYKVDLFHHIEILAVAGFYEMHEKYCRSSSPQALLEEKKKSYHDLFIIEMGKGDAAAKFCETVLKDIVIKNIEDQLSCTELLHDLRVHCGEMFRDIKSIQAAIMVKLFKENSSLKYIQYIGNYKKIVMEEMDAKSKMYFQNGGRLKVLAEMKLDDIVSKIEEAVDRTVSSLFVGKHFMKTFFTKIESLKILHNEASAYMELDVPDKNQFAAILHQQLQSRVRESVIDTINKWNIERKLEQKDLAEFLFKEVVGCSKKCPFCAVPCDAHSGGKTQGNHSATMHRPEGLGGVRYVSTNRLASSDCCTAVASNEKFQSAETNWVFQPYKMYHKWYPTWTIHGNATPDVEKYWKWVFAHHNTAIAHHYSAKNASIPPQWIVYRKAEIAKDIQDNYHVPVDL